MVEQDRQLEQSAIEHLVGRIIYGGRIKRPQDEHVILSLLKEVLTIALTVVKDEVTPRDNDETQSISRHQSKEEDDGDEVPGIKALFPDYIGELSDLTDFVKVSHAQ